MRCLQLSLSRYHHVTVLWFSWYSYVGFTSTCRWFMVSFERNFAKFHKGLFLIENTVQISEGHLA